MRKRDDVPVGGILLFDLFLLVVMGWDIYWSMSALMSHGETFINKHFMILCLLIVCMSFYFCARACWSLIRQQFRDAATFQRNCFLSLLCHLVVFFVSLFSTVKAGGAIGYFNAYEFLAFLIITPFVSIPWLVTRRLALRQSA